MRYFEISDISDIQILSAFKMAKKYQKQKGEKLSEKTNMKKYLMRFNNKIHSMSDGT